jgi:hypothetical protein
VYAPQSEAAARSATAENAFLPRQLVEDVFGKMTTCSQEQRKNQERLLAIPGGLTRQSESVGELNSM